MPPQSDRVLARFGFFSNKQPIQQYTIENISTELDQWSEEGSCDLSVNKMRTRALMGVPEENILTIQCAGDLDDDTVQAIFDDTRLTGKRAFHGFSIIHQPDGCPVFMLPASSVTIPLSNEKRVEYVQLVFDACYKEYEQYCRKHAMQPVDKALCAATVCAGTLAPLNKNVQHYTAMIKPPGTEGWSHVDPFGLLGPQLFNGHQCGGYSMMIEAQAVIKYSAIPLAEANSAPNMLSQFIDEILFKIKTWFAGWRNKVETNPMGQMPGRSDSGTTYGEMSDFSAQELASAFGNDTFLESRQVRAQQI